MVGKYGEIGMIKCGEKLQKETMIKSIEKWNDKVLESRKWRIAMQWKVKRESSMRK